MLIILLVTAAVGVFVCLPFLRAEADNKKISPPIKDDEREHWQSNLEALLSRIEELEQDKALGRIGGGDYDVERERLLVESAQLLKKLEGKDRKKQ